MPLAIKGRECGVKTRAGGVCKNPAGYKTDHVGYGHCSFHGGKSSQQNKYALKLMAQEHALKHGKETSPEEFIRYAVAMAAGEVLFWAAKMEEYLESDSEQFQFKFALKERNRAIDDGARYSALALKAGIEERQTQVVEQFAELLMSTIDTVISGLELTDAQRGMLPSLMERALNKSDVIDGKIVGEITQNSQ